MRSEGELQLSVSPDRIDARDDSAYRIVRHHLIAHRFPGAVEAEFRQHYRNRFRIQTQIVWWGTVALYVVPIVDNSTHIPEHAQIIAPARIAAFVLLVATAAAITFLKPFREEALHITTAVAGTIVSLCSILAIALAPPSDVSFLIFAMSVTIFIRTLFVTTLHYEFSVISGAILLATTLVTVFAATPLSTTMAVRYSFGMTVLTLLGVLTAYVVERYARVSFAQRRIVQHQAAILAEQARRLESAVGDARAANKAKSAFLSNMSHELRTPLNAVLGFSQIVERDPGITAKGREHLRVIRQSGNHLLGLINDVLTISKIEAGHVSLVEAPFDLHEMVQSVADMIRIRTDAKGLEFFVSVEPAAPRVVLGDEGKLRQVLVNLLGNAVKFTNRGGIALRVARRGGETIVEVEDTGQGVAEDEIDRLFEAFAQTESGLRSGEGTGLGLAISRDVVRSMGGDISVQSVVGRGTTFTVTVPLERAERSDHESVPRAVVGLAPGQPSWKILIVDDTPDNRYLLQALLESVGFDCRVAENGQEAVDVWRSWPADLICMDMRMPVLDGVEATRRIRELPGGADCKIVGLTASAFEHERREILGQGVDDVVTKPFRHETIFECLSCHLGVRYLYEEAAEAGEAATKEERVSVDPARLATLPGEDLRELHDALEKGDIVRAKASADRIRVIEEEIGAALLAEIRAFKLDDLLLLIEQVAEP